MHNLTQVNGEMQDSAEQSKLYLTSLKGVSSIRNTGCMELMQSHKWILSLSYKINALGAKEGRSLIAFVWVLE